MRNAEAALSSSSSSLQDLSSSVRHSSCRRTAERNNEQRNAVREEEDEEKNAKITRIGAPLALQWATDVPDLAAKLKERIGLTGPEIVQALRMPLGRVEGAALQTMWMAAEKRIKKSMQGFFFTTLSRRREWDAEQVRAYLDDETKATCGECPTVGMCAYCGEIREAVWQSE
jgi:hypothetical protein